MVPGFGILRLVLLTSVLYVALAVLIEASLFAVAQFTIVTLIGTRSGWWLFFALLWLVAFSIAWQFAPVGPGHKL